MTTKTYAPQDETPEDTRYQTAFFNSVSAQTGRTVADVRQAFEQDNLDTLIQGCGKDPAKVSQAATYAAMSYQPESP